MKQKKTSKKNIHQLNIRHVVIARGSRTALRKIKECMFGNVLDSIECGDWWIPFDSYEYVDIKNYLETKAFHEFFNLPKELKITVKEFQTDILSFHKGH